MAPRRYPLRPDFRSGTPNFSDVEYRQHERDISRQYVTHLAAIVPVFVEMSKHYSNPGFRLTKCPGYGLIRKRDAVKIPPEQTGIKKNEEDQVK